MASRTLAAWLLLAALSQTTSAGPPKGNALAAKLRATTGQQGFCDRFSKVCTRVCKKQKVMSNLCAPSSSKLSDFSCVCSTVDHTKQVLALAVQGQKPVTRHITKTVKVTKTVPGANGVLTLTTSTQLITTDIIETTHSTPTSIVQTVTPTTLSTYTSQNVYTDSVTFTDISTTYAATVAAAGPSTYYDVTGPFRRDLSQPTPAPRLVARARKSKPKNGRTNKYIMSSRLSTDFCKRWASECAFTCRNFKSGVDTSTCSAKNTKALHSYSLACVCKNGRSMTDSVVKDLVPKRMIVSVTNDVRETATATAGGAMITTFSTITTTIHGTRTTLQVAATVLATATAPANVEITTFAPHCGAILRSTIATDRTTKTATKTTPPSVPTETRANLLVNGGFETGDLSGWTLNPLSPMLSVQSSPAPYAGNYYLSIFGGNFPWISQTFSNLVNGDYEMGCWVYTDDPDSTEINFYASNSGSAPNYSDIRDQMTANQWSRVSWRFSTYGTNTFRFDLFKFSLGSWRVDSCYVLLAANNCC